MRKSVKSQKWLALGLAGLASLWCFFVGPVAPAGAVECQAVYAKNASGTPVAGFPAVFDLCFIAPGETMDGWNGPQTSVRVFTADEKAAYIRAAQYWADVLFGSSGASAPVEPAKLALITIITNAGKSYADNAGALGEPYVRNTWQYGAVYDYDGLVALGPWGYTNFGFNGQLPAGPHHLESTIIHELGHALGISARGDATSRDTVFGDKLGKDSAGKWFYTGNTASYGAGTYNASGTGNALTSDAAIRVYNDNPWVNTINGGTAFGIEMSNDSDQNQARSHFGLRNATMSHLGFRNYAVFMEAELAVLKGLGYAIELRDHFGLSIYQNGHNAGSSGAITYTGGFGQWSGTGDFDVNGSYSGVNTTPYATGVHIYGYTNEIAISGQAIRADGLGAGGVRVDGWNNTVNISTEVTAHGDRGTGLLVAYGKEHKITLEKTAGSIKAKDGDAVRFDLGFSNIDYENINADGYGDLSLHSYYQLPDCAGGALSLVCGKNGNGDYVYKDEYDGHKTALAGALVEEFNVAGTLEGGRSAIYISPNSHVKEINILDGAVITGAIISDYDDQWGAATVGKATALNFKDNSGGSPPFVVDGAILGYGAKPTAGSRFYLGRGLINLTMKNGNTSWFKPESRVMVNNFVMESNSTMEITPVLGPNYTVIRSNAFDIKSGSHIDLNHDAIVGRPGPLRRYNPILNLELLDPAGTFYHDNDDYNGPITIEGQTYTNAQYGLEWWRSAGISHGLILDLSGTGIDFGDEQYMKGGHALSSASSMAVNGAGWDLIVKRTRLGHDRRNAYNQVLPPSAGEDDPSGRVWAELFYNHTSGSEGAGRYGYSQNSPGAALGYESWLDDNFLAGAAFSLGLPKYRSEGYAENDGQLATLAAYGVLRSPEFLDLSLTIGHGWHTFDQTRWFDQGNAYGAKYSGSAWRAGAALSRTIDLGEGFYFKPRAAYDFTRLETDAYTETARAGGFFDLYMEKSRQNIHKFTLETELDWQSEEGLGLGLRAGWGHWAGDLRAQAPTVLQSSLFQGPGHTFLAQGQEMDRNALEAGVWLDAPLGEAWSLNLGYEGSYSAHTKSHSGEMKFNFRF